MGCFQNWIKDKHQESLCSRQTWPVGLPLIFSYTVQGLGPASRDHIWSSPQVQLFVLHLTCFGKPQEGAGQECFLRVPMCYICNVDERIWHCNKPYGKFNGCNDKIKHGRQITPRTKHIYRPCNVNKCIFYYMSKVSMSVRCIPSRKICDGIRKNSPVRDRCRLPDVQNQHRSAFTVNVSKNNAYKPIKHLLCWPSSPLHQILDSALKNDDNTLDTGTTNISSAPFTVVLVCSSFTFRRRFFSMPSTAKTCSPTAGRSIPSLAPVWSERAK